MPKDEYTKDWRKLFNHPDREEIEELIESGKVPMDIAVMLRERYPTEKKRQIDHTYLYRFRNIEYPELAEHARKTQYDRMDARRKGLDGSVNLDDIDSEEYDIATRIMKLTGREPPPPMPRKLFNDEQLLVWVNDEDASGFQNFVEDLIIERGERVKLQDYQVDMANLFINNTRVCINAGGQVGKDFMMECYQMWYALTHPGSTQMVVCATQSQSAALMDRTLSALKASEDLWNAYATSMKKPDHVTIFKNESQIFYLTAKSLIAGKTNIDTIWVNEARDIREEEVSRASPLLGIGGGKLFVLSRPRFKKGYFWDCFSGGGYKTMQIPTEWNIHFDRQVLEDDRRTLSPELFKIEYMAEFADAGSAFISEDAINTCCEREYEITAMQPDENYEYSLGIDPARLADVSALILVGRHKKADHSPRYKVFYVHGFHPDTGNRMDQLMQYAHIKLLYGNYNKFGDFKHIVPEYQGMGIGYTDSLIDDWRDTVGSPFLIEPYPNRGVADKLNIYHNAKNIIETHDIEISRRAYRLINELKMTSIGTTAHGHTRIETPVTDDYSDAFCLALWPFKKPFVPGVGIVSRPLRSPYR
uniref:Putative terminase n=2 Tax=viral metagenome TaxID=1070528 RepID=A0A6M3XT78_9ZZZZ